MKSEYEERVQAFIAILDEEYAKFVVKSGKRRVSYNQFARYAGVSTGSMNQYLNGTRLPELPNAMIMAHKFNRPDILDVLGFPQVLDTISDPRISFFVTYFPQLTDETQSQIIGHVAEETGVNYDDYLQRIKHGGGRP